VSKRLSLAWVRSIRKRELVSNLSVYSLQASCLLLRLKHFGKLPVLSLKCHTLACKCFSYSVRLALIRIRHYQSQKRSCLLCFLTHRGCKRLLAASLKKLSLKEQIIDLFSAEDARPCEILLHSLFWGYQSLDKVLFGLLIERGLRSEAWELLDLLDLIEIPQDSNDIAVLATLEIPVMSSKALENCEYFHCSLYSN
jgi:hypothetical protein